MKVKCSRCGTDQDIELTPILGNPTHPKSGTMVWSVSVPVDWNEIMKCFYCGGELTIRNE